jgi:predicted ferric reductase
VVAGRCLAGLDGGGGGVLTWVLARAAGFTAYGLLTCSVVLGLALGLRWRSPRWPRWATTELHRFVTLLTLVFLGLHVLLLALDGYMRFRLVELLVPFANHYRPLWTALGVVAAWLALAVWASTWLQRLIGYRAWRRLHFTTFVVYAAATLHGLQAGSDGHRPWALALYAASALTVAALTAARLAGPRRPVASRHLERSAA